MTRSKPSFWAKAPRFEDGPSVRRHLLPFHCLDVAAVLEAFVRNDSMARARLQFLGFDIDEALRVLCFFAAIHDLGKFSLSFQNLKPLLARSLGVPDKRPAFNYLHPQLGLALWLADPDLAAIMGLDADEEEDVEPLAQAAFGHHGKPLDSGIQRPRLAACFEGVRGPVLNFVRQTAELFLPEGFPRSLLSRNLRPLSWLFAGKLVLADWIGSNETWFPWRQEEAPLPDYLEFARRQAEAALKQAGVLAPPVRRDASFFDLFPSLAGNEPHPMQRYAMEEAVDGSGPELHILEDLTGGGKTESSQAIAYRLMAAGQANGLYIGLPTMATANAMYDRLAATYQRLFEPTEAVSLTLAHGSRSLDERFLQSIPLENAKPSTSDAPREDSGASCSHWLADSNKKALLAPCGAGTLDQALLSVLPAKHQCLRLLGLSRLVLVADEVHAYDPYTFGILCKLLRFQAGLGGSAVLLTATLPRAMRQKLCDAFREGLDAEPIPLQRQDFPLATRVTRDELRETPVETVRRLDVAVALTDDEDQIYKELARAHEADAASCWIRNTVDQAVEARRRLVDDQGLPAKDVILFHARFALADRLGVEQQVLKTFGKKAAPARSGKILVATQVVEQSLDLDFDLLCSDLAPIEYMIQRAGRCHRHGIERPEGYQQARMVVLSPEPVADPAGDWYGALLGAAQYVYPLQAVLWRTAMLLKQHGAIRLPELSRTFMESAYEDACLAAPDALLKADQHAKDELFVQGSLANISSLSFDDGYGYGLDSPLWDDERRIPTRLGRATVQLRLLRLENGRLRLHAGEGWDAKTCALSEVRVDARKAKDGVLPEDVTQAMLDEAKTRMQDGCRYAIALALIPAGDGWRGRVVDERESEQRIQYSCELGLSFE